MLTNHRFYTIIQQCNREAREKEEEERINKERPRIQDQFADLKRGLNTVSMEEWENLPDVGNIAGKNRKKANLRDKFAPVPDSLLPRAQEEMATSLDAQVKPSIVYSVCYIGNFIFYAFVF